MSWRTIKWIYIITIVLTFVTIMLALVLEHDLHMKRTYTVMNQFNENMTDMAALKKDMQQMDRQLNEITNDESNVVLTHASRGGGVRRQVMCVTAYDLGYASCQKYPGDKDYGITASGQKVRDWYTIAGPDSIPFNTRVYIPYFKDRPNKGVFVVTDRGGAIVEGRLDIYMSNSADHFGKKNMEVYILQ